jgi:hypothetical protein
VTGTANSNVVWSVDGVNGGNATVGTINTLGLYTPPSTQGPHTITAASVVDSTKKGNAQLTVTNYAGVFTYHNDNARSGQNTQEIVLKTSNVNQAQFGILKTYSIDGYAIAQPLYVANVNIPGIGFRNVVYVATIHDTVYAFDADGRSTQPLWSRSFIDPANGITTVPVSDSSNGNLGAGPEVGIAGTPVIDPDTGTLYVMAQTKEKKKKGNGFEYPHRLHALDIATGQEKFGGPVRVTASFPGTGVGNDGRGNIPFNDLRHFQRSALLLTNGLLYIVWASHYDIQPYHGWAMVYDALTLQQKGVLNVTPGNEGGGIWMSGGGPSADEEGNVYLVTGDGSFDALNPGGADYGDSILKIKLTANGLSVLDWFTPYNENFLNVNDIDLGSASPLLLPDQSRTTHPHLLVTGSKESRIYLVDRDSLGRFNGTGDTQIVQSIPGQLGTGKTRSSPAYWQNKVYFQAENDVVKAFTLTDGLLSSTPTSKGAFVFGFPGAPPKVSANGSTQGIVWLFQRGPGTLQAYDANDLTRRFYVGSSLGTQVTFATPIIANGKVYVGTTNQLVIYGLLPN